MSSFFAKKGMLLTSVFLTGGAVLVIEVVATRILSPYFGNTIYTVSSVIGVILAALSFGYYVGGRLADRRPSPQLFYAIIVGGGISVFTLRLLMALALPSVGEALPIVHGPLVVSLMLFFIPGFLLGMLSPFAVALYKKFLPEEGLGSSAGAVFFWSTLGSIAGSLAAGFLLIPRYGVDTIITAVAFLLSCLGFAGLLPLGFSKRRSIQLLFLAALFAVISLTVPALKPEDLAKIVMRRDGVYERITVQDLSLGDRPVRILLQDRSYSGATYLDGPGLPFEYTRYYTLFRLFKPDARKVLAIGGGAYSVPNVFLSELPQAVVHVAEIEPVLFDIVRKHFNVPDTPRLLNIVEDGRKFLSQTNETYDVMFSDVYYSLFSLPSHMTTQEFFATAKKRLTPGGVFIANLIGDLSRERDSVLFSEIKTFQSVFPNSYLFAVESPGFKGTQNFIVLGVNGNQTIDFDKTKQSDDEILAGLSRQLVQLERFEFSSHPILTDRYAPVEHLTAALLKRNGRSSLAFSKEEAFGLIDQQLRYGSRAIGTEGSKRVREFLVRELEALGAAVRRQPFVGETVQGNVAGENIIGRFRPDAEERILLGTHFDTRSKADLDRFHPDALMPGANDGASGVAVLLEVARVLKETPPSLGVDIVFFDGEEEGEHSQNSAWRPLGSAHFVEHVSDLYLNRPLREAIIIDMVCDRDLSIGIERSSWEAAPDLSRAFWDSIPKKFKGSFKEKTDLVILDDHTPFQTAGIPSILLIDFTYPHFHTAQDTLDKCSSKSLETIGEALLTYLRK